MDVMVESLAARALEAWSVVRPEPREPERIDVLKGRKERKTVCRLVGAGPSGSDVIAKRYRVATGRVERVIYDEIIPFLPVASLHCYGLVEEANGSRCWLFLEDAAGTRYSPSIDTHRRLAGEWLGLLHTSQVSRRATVLPDRGPSHYRECLAQARANITSSSGNAAFGTSHTSLLDAVLRSLDLLESQWPAIEELCAAMPRTLVHGDFVPKNLRVRESATGEDAALLCFDWGCAGWGNVAVDLAQAPSAAHRLAASPDLDAYWRIVRDRWPACDFDSVRRWASVGCVFRALTTMAWASRSLASAWVDEPVAELRAALGALTDATRDAFGADCSDDDALRRSVGEIIATRCGNAAVLEAIDRRPWDDGSSHPASILNVRLGADHGDALEIFVKDFGAARYATAEPQRQAEREMRVYRDILADAELGTAKLHGVVWDAEDSDSVSSKGGRHWLMLELVRGTPLAHRAYDDDWMAAARWLARLHAHIARDDAALQNLSGLLLRHGVDFFRAAAQRALAEVTSMSPPLTDRLAALLQRCDSSIAVMSGQPPTLVHGGYKPRHILVDDATEPHRICPLDWELAATGSALYDLAFLAYGVRDALVDRLIDAYLQEVLARDLPRPYGKRSSMRRLVDCFRLHRALKTLGRARERGLTEARIAKLIGSAERLAGAAERAGELS